MNNSHIKDPITKRKIRERLNLLSEQIHSCSEELVELKEIEQSLLNLF